MVLPLHVTIVCVFFPLWFFLTCVRTDKGLFEIYKWERKEPPPVSIFGGEERERKKIKFIDLDFKVLLRETSLHLILQVRFHVIKIFLRIHRLSCILCFLKRFRSDVE